MRKKLLMTLAVFCLTGSMLAGCTGGSSAAGESKTTQEQTVETSSEKMSEEQGSSTGENNNEDEKAERVVASSVAVVEILDALGVPVVGVPTSSYELPESAKDAVEIGSPMSPDMEVIASLEPTVIISVDTLSGELTEQFKNLGIENEFVNLSSYDGLRETISSLGKRFQVGDKAEEILSGFDSRESEVAASIEEKEAPEVLILFGAGSNFMTASENTYVGDLAKHVGAVNIITDTESGFVPVDMEYLAEKNPDFILFMSHANPEESLEAFKQEFATNEAWQNFDAVKNDRVYALETGYFGMSANLKAPEAMEKLADILYGEQADTNE